MIFIIFIACVINFSCMPGLAAASEVNDKRLAILQSEKADVQSDLTVELSNYSGEKNKQKADKRIEVLQANLRALDIEIKHALQNKTPEPFFSNEVGSKKGGVVIPRKSSKDAKVIDGTETHREAWDVFNNF